MANPRPCVCGHPASKHGSGLPAFGNRCIACYFSPGDWSGCIYYRPAPRKEPLRASRWLFPSGRKGIVIFSNGARWPIMVQPAPSSAQAHSTFSVRWNDDRHAYEVCDDAST